MAAALVTSLASLRLNPLRASVSGAPVRRSVDGSSSRRGNGMAFVLRIECSSHPQKKATAHHNKSRPKKHQPYDKNRKGPTKYKRLPKPPPVWGFDTSDIEQTVTEVEAPSEVVASSWGGRLNWCGVQGFFQVPCIQLLYLQQIVRRDAEVKTLECSSIQNVHSMLSCSIHQLLYFLMARVPHLFENLLVPQIEHLVSWYQCKTQESFINKGLGVYVPSPCWLSVLVCCCSSTSVVRLVNELALGFRLHSGIIIWSVLTVTGKLQLTKKSIKQACRSPLQACSCYQCVAPVFCIGLREVLLQRNLFCLVCCRTRQMIVIHQNMAILYYVL